MDNLKVLQVLVNIFFVHMITLKMYHFQTKLYSAHKASDEYLINFMSNMDKFMEVGQGQHGIIQNTNIDNKVTMVNDTNIINHLDNFVNVLNRIGNKVFINDNHLIAIRDDMLNDITQLKYLLQFE